MTGPVGPISWSVATQGTGSADLGPYAEMRALFVVQYASLFPYDVTGTRSSAQLLATSSLVVLDGSQTRSKPDITTSGFSFGSWVAKASPRIVSPWSDPVSGTTTIRWVEDRTATASRSQLFSRSSFVLSDVTETRLYVLAGTFFSGSVVWDLTETRLGASLHSRSSFEVRDQTGVRISALLWAPDWEFIYARDASATRSVVIFGATQSLVALQDASISRSRVEIEPKAWVEPPRVIVARPRRRSTRLQSV